MGLDNPLDIAFLMAILLLVFGLNVCLRWDDPSARGCGDSRSHLRIRKTANCLSTTGHLAPLNRRWKRANVRFALRQALASVP